MEGDLLTAGVETVWNVENCPPLAWLNPVNALHILRIVQEAISNVLIHARASTIIVGCEPRSHDGKDGILVSITDNGIGPQGENAGTRGHGLANMKARAEALGGVHRFAAAQPSGSCSTLWLPLGSADRENRTRNR
jgi:signal transduction histidine kinase